VDLPYPAHIPLAAKAGGLRRYNGGKGEAAVPSDRTLGKAGSCVLKAFAAMGFIQFMARTTLCYGGMLTAMGIDLLLSIGYIRRVQKGKDRQHE
jgi:hypothetical protein